MRRLRCGLASLAAAFSLVLVSAAQAADPAPLRQITSSTDLIRLAQQWVSQHNILVWLGYLAVALPLLVGLYYFRSTTMAARLRRTLSDELLSNWRLTLLAITSLALTLASGWTTWDGMTNFTGTPVLSFLITLGIQGVMLIAAWLIGESFAIGLAGVGNPITWSIFDRILAGLSIALLAALFAGLTMWATSHGTIDAIDTVLRRRKSILALQVPSENLRILIALGVSSVLTLLLVTQKEVFHPYFLGLKTILRSLPLWLMFLACMVTSVFFSFDSLFSTIFPQSERERAAQLRTTNQVAGLVADLGTTISKRQAESVDALISSPQWTEFSNRINDIITIARGAPEQIAAQSRKELEEQQSQRAGIQERKATAESQQVRLDKRKEELLSDVGKLKEEVPPVAAEVDRLKGEIFQKESEILAKKAETQAEAGGVGGTLKAGQGPVWTQRKKELDDFAKLKAILDSQLAERASQLKDKRGRLASAEAELAQMDGEIGKLKGEMDVADQQMETAVAVSANGVLTASTQSAASRGFTSLEDAFAQFRQRPERTSYDAVLQQCGALLTVFDKVPAIKDSAGAKGLRCDPSIVAEPVTRILALNDGLTVYKARCAKPDSLPQGSIDDLLTFGQQCLASSGLSGQDTVAYRSQINSIGLNRDDKAHRFVVSWNAFLDGNRLAYLALLIAVALDGLVFMSGLFGANATSSPLVRLPSADRRSASDLEATMYAALRPDVYGRAQLVISALHPIKPVRGFVSEVRLDDFEREEASAIRGVLSMAGQFGAVEPVPGHPGVYLVRGELTEFLSKASERELKSNAAVRKSVEDDRVAAKKRSDQFAESNKGNRDSDVQARANALKDLLLFPLERSYGDDQDSVIQNAERFIGKLRPTMAVDGFTHVLNLKDIDEPERNMFLGVLNAAATGGSAQPSQAHGAEVYLLRPEVMRCLQNIGREELEKAKTGQVKLPAKQRMLKMLWPRDGSLEAGQHSKPDAEDQARITDGRQNGTAAQRAFPAPDQNGFKLISSNNTNGHQKQVAPMLPAADQQLEPGLKDYLSKLSEDSETDAERQAFDALMRKG